MHTISNLTITESNPSEPVSLADIKTWLQVDFDDFDALLTSMGKGARQAIEKWTGQPLVAKTVTFDVEVTTSETVQLPLGTADDVTIVELDSEDGESDVTDAYFRVNTIRMTPGRYNVTYTANAVSNEDVKEAIKMEVAERFANRGDNSKQGISEGAKEKLAPYRQVWL